MAKRPINNTSGPTRLNLTPQEAIERTETLRELRLRGKLGGMRMTQPEGAGGGVIGSTQTVDELGASGKGQKWQSIMIVVAKFGISTTGNIIQYPPIKDGSWLKELTDKLNKNRGPGGGMYGQTMPVVKIGDNKPYGSSDFNGPIVGGFTVIQMGIITKAHIKGMLTCNCTADCKEETIGARLGGGATFEEQFDKAMARPKFDVTVDADGGFYLDMDVRTSGMKWTCGGDCETTSEYIDENSEFSLDFREYLFVIGGRFPKGETVFDGKAAGSFMRAVFRNQLNEPTPDGTGGSVYSHPDSPGGVGVGSRPDGYKGTPTYGEVLKKGLRWADNHSNICGIQSYTL